MANEFLAEFGRCLEVLDYRFTLDEENDRIYTSFQGTNSPYWVNIRATGADDSIRFVRFRSYISLREHNVPIMAVAGDHIVEAHRFVNYLNARWMDAGHVFLDPDDGDLTLDWAVPIRTDLTPDYVGFLLRFAGQVDHFFPEVWSILTQGMTSLEAIAAHRARDEESSKSADDSASGQRDDQSPSDETFPFPE